MHFLTGLKRLSYGFFLLFILALALTGYINMEINAQNKSTEGKLALSADTSLGKVVDREGIASIKAVLSDRWSVAEENLRLETGDWLMTGTRGANALAIRLNNGSQIILGPGTLLELVDARRGRLVHGEIEVTASQQGSFTVLASPKTSIEVQGTKILRAQDDRLTLLSQTPRWLLGYKNDLSTEAMGSLLANVDGRNVPLTIGYHKVTVDIRDQIARTQVEESFINTTDRILEGVFYFPLPQDASISGFAMWIGDEMVEAEIVEKQRAREIYETILRERRDPGLLEWTGGNIFKARVFPISSEKRIKITYTQVLPKTDNVYRYNYALQSEMLRLHPLKKLQIDVKINSIEPLAAVESASHACRIEVTGNSAHAEFAAEEYVPTQDFELNIATKPVKNNIVMVNHRRGDDGYFMVLVNAPQESAQARRPLLANSAASDFIIIADTSGSMTGTARENQITFIEALLSSLGTQDSFNLLTCDVVPRWAFKQAVANSSESREKALQFLEKRQPLGWSDLDATFAAIIDRLNQGTQVVYVGDGILTTGNADPVAFAQRLAQLYRGNGIFHAVATGSSYESVVLRGIAGLGGGSIRTIGGGTDPAQTAFQLLKEITSPAIKNVQVSFQGVPIAAVYPETLANLPTGTQQFVVGRYDPRIGDIAGKIMVTGLLNGEKVAYSQDVKLAANDAGNSFIPRLWARQHLDYLLAQGQGEQIKEQIIALSEDYQIITPYTSFLVLESDADRERFNIRKRFRMRDGEEFFATGRDNANFELARKQMIKAKNWRLQLRTQLLQNLVDMNHGLIGELLVRRYELPEVTTTNSELLTLTSGVSNAKDSAAHNEFAVETKPKEGNFIPTDKFEVGFPSWDRKGDDADFRDSDGEFVREEVAEKVDMESYDSNQVSDLPLPASAPPPPVSEPEPAKTLAGAEEKREVLKKSRQGYLTNGSFATSGARSNSFAIES
ncbi:MAG: VIT domain-containing protein, partial [Acidobacteriota bacterium]